MQKSIKVSKEIYDRLKNKKTKRLSFNGLLDKLLEIYEKTEPQ